MPFGGQIFPEPVFFELGSHWGQRCAISMGRARAFRRPISLVRPRRSRFSRYVVTAWEFLLCFPRGLVQEKKTARFLNALGTKRTRLPAKRSKNKTLVRRKSLRKPMACVNYTLPPRGRARWTESTRERGTRETRETSHPQQQNGACPLTSSSPSLL